MNTYTIQTHNPTGETYALRYNDQDIITGVFGPMHYEDVERVGQLLGDIAYETDDNTWANTSAWQAPITIES